MFCWIHCRQSTLTRASLNNYWFFANFFSLLTHSFSVFCDFLRVKLPLSASNNNNKTRRGTHSPNKERILKTHILIRYTYIWIIISNINNNIFDYGKRERTSVRNNHTLLSLHLSLLFIPGSKIYVVLPFLVLVRSDLSK